jgi:hypothetical protein
MKLSCTCGDKGFCVACVLDDLKSDPGGSKRGAGGPLSNDGRSDERRIVSSDPARPSVSTYTPASIPPLGRSA